jgi:site-specific recombinase XerD
MAQIDDTIATYLTAVDVEGKTPNTVLSYRASLQDFRSVGRRLDFPQELEAYSVEHVYRFLGDLKQRSASPAYQHRRHREVKTFFSWCRRMDYVQANVFAKVPLVRLEQQIRPPFSPDEIGRLLDSLDRSALPGCRNHALILFLLDSGVRVSECVSIGLDDVDWERGRVRVRETKNKHDRWVGFGERTARAMRDYVERFRGERPGELFLTAAGEPMASGNTQPVTQSVGRASPGRRPRSRRGRGTR